MDSLPSRECNNPFMIVLAGVQPAIRPVRNSVAPAAVFFPDRDLPLQIDSVDPVVSRVGEIDQTLTIHGRVGSELVALSQQFPVFALNQNVLLPCGSARISGVQIGTRKTSATMLRMPKDFMLFESVSGTG